MSDNNQPKPEIVIRLLDWRQLHLNVDLGKCPSSALAQAMLRKALRTLELEDENAYSVAFAQRIARAQNEAQISEALLTGRKQ